MPAGMPPKTPVSIIRGTGLQPCVREQYVPWTYSGGERTLWHVATFESGWQEWSFGPTKQFHFYLICKGVSLLYGIWNMYCIKDGF